MKLLIKGGRVIDPANKRDELADILVEAGKIVKIAQNITDKTDEVIEAAGKWVVPGFIDMHVHLREPGFEAKETIYSGTRAAARGGFTGVACMPNTNPVVDNIGIVEFIKARAIEDGIVNVYPIGAITKGSKGDELAEIGDMKQRGIVAISDDGQPVPSSEVMRNAMEYAKMFDLLVISHSEEKKLAGDGVMNEGYWSTILGLKGIPNAAEDIMVAREIILSETTSCPVHIAHVSTEGSVRLIREAKGRGVKVTAEAAPHHFSLTDEYVATLEYSTSTKVNPPLRKAKDLEAVKKGLQDGTIDVIATDHAPHTIEEKDVEFNYAPFGMVGLETAFGLVMKELVETGVLEISQAIAKLTINPAQLLRLDKGTLGIGKDADITIVDPELEEIVDPKDFATKGKNSPFVNWKLKGLPVATIVGGKLVMNNRKLMY
jgi:dihydroorotase